MPAKAMLALLLFGATLMRQSPTPGLYASDASHISNRLYNTLFVRQSRGRVFGYDELDPLLWRESNYLLAAPGYQNAISVLDDFLKNGSAQMPDPLKRAVLQHDLWAIFDWIAEGSNYPAERTALAGRLARAIRSLALTADQIRSLPNTYADAVASKAFHEQYDPDNPRIPFLPPDLFAAHGSWVELSAFGGGVVAPSHAYTFSERSMFRVFIHLPNGRQATLEYLNRLRDFRNFGSIVSPPGNDERVPQFQINPDVPQFPPGTMVALVRQMILIDGQGKLVSTKVTESVQLRVYNHIGGDMSLSFNPARGNTFQDFFEFKMTRTKLFASQTGGLHAVTPDETELPVFASYGIDMVDREGLFSPGKILDSCRSCHFRPGIHSVLSFDNKKLIPAAWDEADITLGIKGSTYSWGLLTGLWAK